MGANEPSFVGDLHVPKIGVAALIAAWDGAVLMGEGEDTIVSITDHNPAEEETDRIQRAIYWASTLLSLLQVSRTGSAPEEYQER